MSNSSWKPPKYPLGHPLERIAKLAQAAGPIIVAESDLPFGFVYPHAFLEHIAAYGGLAAELDPWYAEPGRDLYDTACSEAIGRPVVMFAKADLEDMIACFIIEGEESGVVVLNPYVQHLVEGEWKQTSKVIAELPNFNAWVEWALGSDLVRRETVQQCSPFYKA